MAILISRLEWGIADQVRDNVGWVMSSLQSSRPPSRDPPFLFEPQIPTVITHLALRRQEIADQARDDVGWVMSSLQSSRSPSRDPPFLFEPQIPPVNTHLALRKQEIAD